MQQSKVSVKYSEENSVFGRVSYYHLLEFAWEGVRWGGRLFEAGRLLTFSAFRMGLYSRWTLIHSNKYGIAVHVKIKLGDYTLNNERLLIVHLTKL